jgi:TonB-linked SusC/RagA family outer membrane protein
MKTKTDFLFKVMRITCTQILVLIITAGIIHAHNLKGQGVLDEKLTIKLTNENLKTVLFAIEQKTRARFIYNHREIQPTNKVSVEANNQRLEEVLRGMLLPIGIVYEADAQQIILSRLRNAPVPDFPLLSRQKKTALDNRFPLFKVSGKITDDKEEPLVGATVILEGTSKGVFTDMDGKFNLEIEDNEAKGNLVVSFIGYQTQTVPIEGRTIINIQLKEGRELEEVVVTALGVKKQSKSLGYATATVGGEDVSVNRSVNFMNALQGKMAGVNITALGSGAAGTSKIRIRGQSSFGGNNSPLIVVNGVPIDNTNNGARGDVSERGSNRTSDGGDGLSSINPDDIESMTVLKGAAASALYGSRAKDGVIMITTKSGAKGQGITITYNANYTSEKPLDYTDYQYEYGQGENGLRPTTPFPTSGQWSFGEKFQPGMTQILFNNINAPYEPQRGIINQFYRTGNTLTNTLTISSGGQNGGFSLSGSQLSNTAILEGSGYQRRTVNLGFSQTFANKLIFSGNINYSNENRINPPNIAEQDYSPVIIYNMANSMPLKLLRENASDANGNETVWSRFTNRTNPYFALKRFDNIVNDRVFGNLTSRYNITDWLFIQARVGQDYYSREQEYNLPTGTQRQVAAPAGFVNGQYVQDSRTVRELNADFLIGVNKNFGKIGVNLSAGGNQMYRKISRLNVLVQDFYVRDLYSLSNGRAKDPVYDFSERQVNSLYGSAEVSFNDVLFFTGTARNDWFSTLSPANRSILYPSLTVSYVISQSLRNKLPEWLSFAKIRAAYAEVGSDTDVQPYSNNLFYNINTQLFGISPLGSIAGSIVPNANLRPMRVSENEVGLELKLLDYRIGIDISYYDKLSSDQILRKQASNAGGFLTELVNVGKSRNQGVELLLDVEAIRTANFKWNSVFNIAYNQSEVIDLGGLNEITVGTGEFTGELRQVVGKPLGQLYGFGYLRDASGKRIFDSGNGRPLRTATQIAFGSAVPVYVGGFTNIFTYKNFDLSVLIDFKLGHKMISGTNFNAWRHGLHKGTLIGRDENFVIGDGVNSKGEVNTVKSGVQAFYETVRASNIAEEFVANAGLWQLRQITFGYNLSKLVKKVTFIKGAKLSIVANNIAVLKKWVDNIHPEQFGFPSDNLVGLEATGLPVTRNVGLNLNVRF